MSDCVFCSIVSGDSAAYHVYEDDQSIAFLDVEPAACGHTLVVPKSHHESLLNMPEDIVGRVFQTVQRVAVSLDTIFGPGGINLVQSNGRPAGQDVFHAHVHVIPRYDNDSVNLTWTPEEVDDRSQQEIATAIRDKLASLSC